MDQSGISDIPAQFLENPPEPLKPETGLVGKLLGVLMTLFGMAIMIGGAVLTVGKVVVLGAKGALPALKVSAASLPKLVPLAHGFAKAVLVFMTTVADEIARGVASVLNTLPDILQGAQAVNVARPAAPVAAEAAEVTTQTVSTTFADFYWMLTLVFLCAVGFLVLSVLPIILRLFFRRKTTVFLSYSHTREAKSVEVSDALYLAGLRIKRIPYNPEYTHQQVVRQTQKAIRKSDIVVCLPGDDPSFVDNEVATANGQGKPILFCLDDAGTLPNTADKRYPSFRLSQLEADKFRSLTSFLHYIGGDLRSTWGQIWRALVHPFVWVSLRRVALVVLGLLFCLFAISVIEVLNGDASRTIVFGDMTATEFVSSAGMFVLVSGAMLAVTGYLTLVSLSLWRQWRAQRLAKLKIGEAEFSRDSWVGQVPGLKTGSALYEAMFAVAPKAHHERLAMVLA